MKEDEKIEYPSIPGFFAMYEIDEDVTRKYKFLEGVERSKGDYWIFSDIHKKDRCLGCYSKEDKNLIVLTDKDLLKHVHMPNLKQAMRYLWLKHENA